MYGKEAASWWSIGIRVVGILCGLWPTILLGATNSYVPAAGGPWNAPGNWSLGHCPLPTESVQIIVSGNANKAVDYNWTGISNFAEVLVDGSAGGYYGAIWHLDYALATTNMKLGDNGPAWHWMEGPAYLGVDTDLHIGYDDPGVGHFYMSVSGAGSGLHVGDLCYIGYQGDGDFDHIGGSAEIGRLYVGQNAPGTYWLKGSETTSVLTTAVHEVIGNGDVGTFEQTGGTHNTGVGGIIMGLNTGGVGTYNMKGGTLNADHLSLAWNGDAFFNHTGGTVNTTGDINIGCQGTHPQRAWYKLSEADGPASLNVGDDLLIGPQTLAKYEQTGGTAIVTGNVEIWKGSTDTTSSYLYMGLSAGTLKAAELINHTGYFDQDGGTFTVSSATNDSSQGMNLDNNAIFEARNLWNTAGTFWMYRNARLRGPLAIPPSTYWICEFTNDATFQMGSVASNGGTFGGHLTNNGTFNYYQGDFSVSRLTNNGTFNNNGAFSCLRLVNNATHAVMPGTSITASGGSYANAIENNLNLTIHDGGTVTLTSDKKLVNNDNLYAGGTINGDLENNDYLLPANGTSATDQLDIQGNFKQSSAAQLRIRLGGTVPADQYDRIDVSGHAELAGTLDVRLINGFTPGAGDRFQILEAGSRTGVFNPVMLPALLGKLSWRLDYYSTPGLALEVVVGAPPAITGWSSIRTHGSAGTLEIPLDPTDGQVTTECRNEGIKLVAVDFSRDVTALYTAGQIVVTGGLMVTGEVLTNGGTRLEVRLGGSTDKTCYSINVFNSVAGLSGDADCSILTLTGDANSDKRVSTTDMALVRSRVGQSPAASQQNTRCDLNVDGSISTTDMALCRSRVSPDIWDCP